MLPWMRHVVWGSIILGLAAGIPLMLHITGLLPDQPRPPGPATAWQAAPQYSAQCDAPVNHGPIRAGVMAEPRPR